MKSVKPSSDKRRRTYTRLVGEISHALNQALVEEHEDRNLTRAQMAAALGWNRASITKLLSGSRNMTLETLADLAFALDRPIRVSLPSRARRTNKRVGNPDASDSGSRFDAASAKPLEAQPA
ncbi:helix-turn-helix transcriptional regulator [Reyranella sp.]|uniref:helix-turn-helix transcriptional regulator n=1 Tax=Reyranella sp. TaxID=1929291 RepID=UPI004034FB45